MQRTFTWSLQWQLFCVTLLVLVTTLLLFTWIIGNLFLTAWDRQLATRLTLVADIAQVNLPLDRLSMYGPDDESMTLYKQDHKALSEFAKAYQLDHITFLSQAGLVTIDSGNLLPGMITGYSSLLPQNPAGTLTRLHRNRQGQWQKLMLWPINDDLLMLISAGSEMFSVIERVNTRRNVTLGFGIVLALVLSWIMSLYLGKKFSRLTKALRALQAGDQSVRVKTQGTDEIAYLSRTFNEMARALEIKTKQERELHEKRVSELKVLSAGVAHEIRNPLAAISGLADLLARQQIIKTSDESQDLVGRIRSEITRMDKIVLEVMAYARQPALNIIAAPITKVFEECKTIEPKIAIKQTGTIPTTLQVDFNGFITVLRNLLVNARDAAGPEGQVTLQCKNQSDHFYLLISDTGPGVPSVHRETIFQPFFSKKAKGTGLGLAIARNIIEAHGGTLELTPCPTGACFQIALPLFTEV
jgi:signal transduction histidine kinase